MACTPDTTPPQAIAVAGSEPSVRSGVHAASSTNVNLAAFSDGDVIDGVPFHLDMQALLYGQTAPSANGIYRLGSGNVFTGDSFNGAGVLTYTSGANGLWWHWEKGNATSIVGDTTLTQSGLVKMAGGTSFTINGPASTPFTGTLRAVGFVRAEDFNQASEFDNGMRVSVSSGTVNGGHTFRQTSPSAPVIGTDPITFVDEGMSFIPLTVFAPDTTPPGTIDPCAVAA